MYKGQAGQDKFVVNILKGKENGFFVEIGSNDPININNSYILEKNYNWKGIMVEYDRSFLQSYINNRPNSIHIIDDATKINYKNIFTINNVPLNMDYLQIDLEVENGSTIETLEKLDKEVLDTYKFATITFEHDIYRSNYKDTRQKSREIFEKRGYYSIFKDIHGDGYPFEDWYVHPDLVDMEYIKQVQTNNNKYYKPTKVNNIMGISWNDIEY